MAEIPADILDPAVLQTLLNLDDGGYGLAREMTGLFREDIAARLEVLEKAWSEDDAQTVAEAAHAIKGAAGAVGALRLQKLSGEVEKAGRSVLLESVAGIRDRLRPAYDEALAALVQFSAG
jgi:HPt (histidine-containing phosphotransfer) domain-containing protein